MNKSKLQTLMLKMMKNLHYSITTEEILEMYETKLEEELGDELF